jgi:hypothetical protein
MFEQKRYKQESEVNNTRSCKIAPRIRKRFLSASFLINGEATEVRNTDSTNFEKGRSHETNEL